MSNRTVRIMMGTFGAFFLWLAPHMPPQPGEPLGYVPLTPSATLAIIAWLMVAFMVLGFASEWIAGAAEKWGKKRYHINVPAAKR